MNENHRRAIASAFAHIDGLLRDIEKTAAATQSPFSDVAPDLEPTQRQVIGDYLEQLRGQLVDALRRLDIPRPPPRVAASWAIQVSLNFAEISLEDTSPSRLRGYGPLSDEDRELITRIEDDLERTLRRLRTYLAQGLGKDLGARLAKLQDTAVDANLLRALERTIREQGLVEFRGALEALIERLEVTTFEIAVFGRVSSGKSSLLNAVLEMNVLPVGVTPVTAVPTRITWGEPPGAEVRFAEAPAKQIPLEQLVDYVSEQANPANRRRVVRVIARVPSPKLRADLVFVDTPGVGSLATAGARESYAYLPRCDLGVLLVDAGSAPGVEDLQILRLLYESGIPAQVVLSKADLLSDADRERARRYLHEAIKTNLGIDLDVHLVSTAGPHAALARAWFEAQLSPLRERAASLARESAHRKLVALREGVVASLKVMLAGSGHAGGHDTDSPRAKIEELALSGEQSVRQATGQCDRVVDQLSARAAAVLEQAARDLSRDIVAGAEPRAGEVVLRALQSAADAARSEVRDALLAARGQLRANLADLAKLLAALPTRPEDVEVELVSLPALAAPPELAALALDWSRWTRLVPSLLEHRLQEQLHERALEPVRGALSSLAANLRQWSQSATARLAEHFAAQAEPFRAHARRQAGEGRPGDDAALRAALRDLGEPDAPPA